MSVPLTPELATAPRRGPAEEAPSPPRTLLLDWDRTTVPGDVPRRLEVEADAAPGSWLVVPHARYVLCGRAADGRIETVYVASLIGKRDSLIPAGSVDSISMDEHSVTVVVEGRPYLYAVDGGATLDVLSRRVLGAS